jgi:hypothetical protein
MYGKHVIIIIICNKGGAERFDYQIPDLQHNNHMIVVKSYKFDITSLNKLTREWCSKNRIFG